MEQKEFNLIIVEILLISSYNLFLLRGLIMNNILSAISFMSRSYNNSRVINQFIRQIKFINHVYRKEDEILIVNLEVHKFPFRTSYLTAATLTDVNLADFSFYIENNSLYIRFNNDEIDSVFGNFSYFYSY